MSGSSYEIQVFRNGNWTIQAFFDDKELALLEARRMSETSRFPAVRVIEEIGDSSRDDVTQRVVYRWSEVEKPLSALHEEDHHRQEQALEGRRRPQQAPEAAPRTRRPKWLQPDSYVVIAAKGVGILILSGALIYGINALGS